MGQITVKYAAQALGVDPQKLRRWIREGKFDDIKGVRRTMNGYQPLTIFTRDAITEIADRIDVTANFATIDDEQLDG